jgi:hypothetical protein
MEEKIMKSGKNLAIVILLTITLSVAFASPASATGFVSGLTKFSNGTLAGGITVQATNVLDSNVNFTAVSGNIPGTNLGSYVVNIPATALPGNYTVTAINLGSGFIASSVGNLFVTDTNTTVAQDLVLTEVLFPTFKIDTVTQNPIPADGVSTTIITATILDQHQHPLVNGDTHNSSLPLVNVSFFLRNGSLNVATLQNGTLTGGNLQVLNLPLNGLGQASVTFTCNVNTGNVVVFNNATLPNANGQEVNASTTITCSPLQAQIHGTVVSSEGLKLPNATVNAYRLLWTQNISTGIWTKTWEFIKTEKTDSTGDYTLAFLPLKFDDMNSTGNGLNKVYQYAIETHSNATLPFDQPPPLGTNRTGLLTNYVLVTASLAPFNNGSASNFLIVDTTDTMDIVLTSGQPDQLVVQVDGSVHQLLDSPVKNADGVSTWTVTAQLMKSGVNFAIPGQVITFVVDDSTVAKFGVSSTTTAATDASGKATVTLTSTIIPGTVKVTGSFVTRDNVLLTDFDFAKSSGVAQLSGIVTNDNQVQLAGATVTLFLDKFNNGTTFVPAMDINGILLGSRVTPPTGPTTYTFVAVPSGTYKVVATLGNQSGFAYPVNLTSGTTTANVVIVGGVPTTISGTVTNASNSSQGIVGASIFLDGVDTFQDTSVGGSYILTNVPAGSHNVMAVANGYTNGTVNVTVSAGTTATANIVLTPASGSCVGDLNGDGNVNSLDFVIFAAAYGTHTGDASFNAAADLNHDGNVNSLDFVIFAANYGTNTSTCTKV